MGVGTSACRLCVSCATSAELLFSDEIFLKLFGKSTLRMGSQALDRIILESVDLRGSIDSYEFAKELQKDHQVIVGAIKSIHSLGEVS